MPNYAVIENQTVSNTVVAEEDFAQQQGWILLEEGFGIGDSYINGKFIKAPQPAPSPEEIKERNKTSAMLLLQQTDWTATIDISNPEYSNPYLTNQSDFLNYRSQLRAIAINPPETLIEVWPTKPDEIWSN